MVDGILQIVWIFKNIKMLYGKQLDRHTLLKFFDKLGRYTFYIHNMISRITSYFNKQYTIAYKVI